MRTSPNEFEAYLAPGESVVSGTTGTLLDDSFGSEGAVGLTDRRVLFVAEGDGFLDVAHHAISSIRSRPRRGFSYRGMGPLVLAVLGAGVAVTAFVGVLALEPGILGFVLTLVAGGGVAAAERVRRSGGDADWPVLDRAARSFLDELSAVDRLAGPIDRARVGSDPDLVVLGVVTISLIALVGLIAATESLLVVPLVLAAIGGVALAEYGYREERTRAASRDDGPAGREVSVHLVDGSVVRLRIGPDVRFERTLSVVVRESAPWAATAGPARP